MSKSCPDAAFDAMLANIAAANIMHICSAQPANYAGIAAVSLASVAMTPGDGNGDFDIDDDTSGRKLTMTAKPGITVATPGTANHIVLALTTGSVLKYITTCTAKAITGTVDIPSWKIGVADPT